MTHTVAPQLTEEQLHRRASDIRIDSLERSVQQVSEGLEQNTIITNGIKLSMDEGIEILNALKGGLKVMGWLGKFAKWVAAIAAGFAAIYAFVQNIRGHS